MTETTTRTRAGGATIDRLGAAAVLIFLAIAVSYGWTHFPRPPEGGPLVLGTASVLATAGLFRRYRAGHPLFTRMLAFAGVILFVQAAMQGAAATGMLGQ